MSGGKDDFIGVRTAITNSGKKSGTWYIRDFKELTMSGGSGCWLLSGRDELKGR